MCRRLPELRNAILSAIALTPFALAGCAGKSDAEDTAPAGDTDTAPETVASCADEIDDDGDGWTDADDPDCATGTDEAGFGTSPCNDGADNEADGLTDSEDDGCSDAADPSEAWPCEDGLDGDGDGWMDADDPDCATGTDESGTGSTDCNDGVDGDGDGLTDSEDDGCADANDPSEQPDCEDGLDGDGDGWTDIDDPECRSGDEEVGYGTNPCNDGVDGDGDGLTDSEDDGCDGATDESEDPDCADGIDGDGDGWIDAGDPDCAGGGTQEYGYGTTACNDGADNDGDGTSDADDANCFSAEFDSESDECSWTIDARTGCYSSSLSPSEYYYMCMTAPSGGCEAAADMDTTDLYQLADGECGTYAYEVDSAGAYATCGPVADGSECCYVVTGLSYYFVGGGRPFDVDGAPRVASETPTPTWSAAVPVGQVADRALRRRLARAWRDLALAEHASVASFARFQMHLLALGAPPELLLAAARAAADEVSHARLCFGIATSLDGERVGPGPLDVAGAIGVIDAAAIVVAAVREGCIGETLSAAEAAYARDVCEDPGVRRSLAGIAADEERHALLAWRFVRWAVDAFPETREAAVAAFEEALTVTSPPLPAADARAEDLGRWGILDARTRQRLAREALDQVVRPCAETLLTPPCTARTPSRIEA